MLSRSIIRNINKNSNSIITNSIGLKSILPIYSNTIKSTTRLLSTTDLNLSKDRTFSENSSEYIPSGRIIIDSKGNKTLVNPMNVNDELPDPLIQQRLNRKIFIIFVGVMSITLFGIFNYEKVSSPIMNATMYFLRRSTVAREKLGKEITFAGLFPYIKGHVNTMKGHINVTVKVCGDKREAVMRLRGDRDSRQDQFAIEEWTLTFEDGEIIDLLKDQSIDLKF